MAKYTDPLNAPLIERLRIIWPLRKVRNLGDPDRSVFAISGRTINDLRLEVEVPNRANLNHATFKLWSPDFLLVFNRRRPCAFVVPTVGDRIQLQNFAPTNPPQYKELRDKQAIEWLHSARQIEGEDGTISYLALFRRNLWLFGVPLTDTTAHERAEWAAEGRDMKLSKEHLSELPQ